MSTFPHDSFLGGLNLFIRENRSVIINKGERPPFPILISSPSFGQALQNLNKADFGIVLAFFALGRGRKTWRKKKEGGKKDKTIGDENEIEGGGEIVREEGREGDGGWREEGREGGREERNGEMKGGKGKEGGGRF